MSANARFLVCPPDLYEVDYVINPWMEGNIHRSSRAVAIEQWQALYDLLQKSAVVEKITPQAGLPDMVFTANAGVAVGKKFVLIRVHGKWWRVQDQRMDGVIVVDANVARCTLFRYLRPGEQVVVGSKGVRTVRQTESRDVRGGARVSHEFSFMGAGVSSERRVELLVDQISWEMHRIREQGGKSVVVPGPVVIHTGGGEHLAWLIRHGYIQALLGGNAIGVHDIEQALLGTSLGVDLKRHVGGRRPSAPSAGH